jgi:hypothetical protein
MTARTIADKLRALADFVEKHPALEQFPELFEAEYFGRHYFGDDAAKLDVFADAFGTTIEHRVHGPSAKEPGARYSFIWAQIDGLEFRPQAYTEDYEKATGKTVPLPPEEVERRLAAEAEHAANTPLPGGAS